MIAKRSDFGHLSTMALQAIALLAALRSVSPLAQAQEGYAITEVIVVAMDQETVLKNRTVLVRDDRITAN